MEIAPIRWGILATGGIATSFTEDLATLPDCEVVAVGSRSRDSADAFAAAHAIGRAYGSWQALADDPDVDVVYVATPHSAHHAATMVCLRAGKAVLCEKPFTLDLETSEELVATARERGLFLMEAMWTRTNPVIRHVGEVIASGEIGEVTAVTADFGVQGPFEPAHRMRNPDLGGGALLDLGVYPISFAHLFLGPPTHLRAWASLYPEGTDTNTAVILGYASGAVATLHCGTMGDTANWASIVGTAGRIEVPRRFFCPDRFRVCHGDACEEFSHPVRGHGMVYEAEEVMRCLRAGLTESPLIPLDSTLDVMRTLDAVRAQIGVAYP